MTTLRERVVEAGARAFFADDRTALDRLAPPVQDVLRDDAANALDAMLDVLAENWEDWRDASWEFPSMPTEKRLIEALREQPDEWRKYQGHVSAMPPSLREDR